MLFIRAGEAPLFTVGAPASDNAGLEALAEDGEAAALGETAAADDVVSESGVFSVPVGAEGPGPLLPGSSYSFSFTASQGDWLSFATMYVQSNDLFFGPVRSTGIDLFPGGEPIGGDITGQIELYDAGTEVDEELHTGANQAPRQSGLNTGADENGNVEVVTATNIALAPDQTDPPVVNEIVRITIEGQ